MHGSNTPANHVALIPTASVHSQSYSRSVKWLYFLKFCRNFNSTFKLFTPIKSKVNSEGLCTIVVFLSTRNFDLLIKIDMIVVAMFHKVRIPRDVIG